ncbi:hypothetical protein SDJN03_24492, partial [Cucurbita argyrosperma subsp. sororia]
MKVIIGNMESKRVAFVAILMIMVMVGLASAACTNAIKLVSDGENEMESGFGSKMMKNEFPIPIDRCGLVLRRCDSDCHCPSPCICLQGTCT